MRTKITDFSEMENVLSVKSDINDGIITLSGRFALGKKNKYYFRNEQDVVCV